MSRMPTTTPLRSEKLGLPRTDFTRWRLDSDNVGRLRWSYLRDDDELAKRPQSAYEKHVLGLDTGLPEYEKARTPREASLNGLRFLKELQQKEGHWPCRYGGPMFLLIGIVVVHYVTKTPVPEEWKIEIIRYLTNTAHPVDGGWGLHSEDKSTVFGTTSNYVVLRLLGMEPDHPVAAKARATLHKFGGALLSPHWGKIWLAILNTYEWEGVNPVPPDAWVLPDWLPVHPSKWWIHCRNVYLPMGYLYSERVKADLDPLLLLLRQELYTQPYDEIDFSKHRNSISAVDIYYPHTKLLDMTNRVIVWFEKYVRPEWLKRKATQTVIDLVHKEDENTDYLCVGPINNVLNALVVYVADGPESKNFLRHRERFADFMYMSSDGMLMMGTNGVQCWDTSFILQTMVGIGAAELPEFHDTIKRGLSFLQVSQFTENCVPGSYRDERLGCWPFSTKHQGYTVSDCTAEALKAVLMVQELGYVDVAIPDEKLHPAIDVLLNLQNRTSAGSGGLIGAGSFASYEKIRGPVLLESMNPAEVFGNIMVEYPYVECSDSVVIGLSYFRDHSSYRHAEVVRAIADAITYIKSEQDEHGGWYGSWGICYTYAGMFALEALSFQGEVYGNSDVVRRGCEFLVKRQESDGGWGESYRSCETVTYISHERSQVVNTAWACLALMLAEYPDVDVIRRGLRLLLSRQQADGSWNQEGIEGVFNRSCMIEYPNYKFNFPIKALGYYAKKYGNERL
ncbi:terpenoid cyclases/protein prenyltransferase alpha-alpha toroid [Lipomyces japonicus]|uniref:terpenoid cyclases/protein prenyltransferase alpha-alpha toroid n=1 Tax=Lipomyces japonicus TaxID=56871 RepID=UPI0034CFA25D